MSQLVPLSRVFLGCAETVRSFGHKEPPRVIGICIKLGLFVRIETRQLDSSHHDLTIFVQDRLLHPFKHPSSDRARSRYLSNACHRPAMSQQPSHDDCEEEEISVVPQPQEDTAEANKSVVITLMSMLKTARNQLHDLEVKNDDASRAQRKGLAKNIEALKGQYDKVGRRYSQPVEEHFQKEEQSSASTGDTMPTDDSAAASLLSTIEDGLRMSRA